MLSIFTQQSESTHANPSIRGLLTNYKTRIQEIIRSSDGGTLFINNSHLLVQLCNMMLTTEDEESYYRGSIETIRRALHNKNFTSPFITGRIQEGFLFKAPIKEGIMYHTDWPEQRFRDKHTDIYEYRPVKLVYHPYTKLQFNALNGTLNEIPNTGDIFTWSVINIPHLVLQYRNYTKLQSITGQEVDNKRFVVEYIIIPLMLQFADISLYNRMYRQILGVSMDDDRRDLRVRTIPIETNLLDKRIKQEYKESIKNIFMNLVSIAPTINPKGSLDSFSLGMDTITQNNLPFSMLSRLSLTEMMLDISPRRVLKRSRSELATLKIASKRMIRAGLIPDYIKDKEDRQLFTDRIEELQEIKV